MIVNDKMQQGYEYHYATAIGADFAPDFKPQLTPPQMLELGVFEGHYLNDCQNEFPQFWFERAKLSPLKPDAKMNYFQVKSRMNLADWQKKGWIIAPDVRGWFQWYCRYYMGRRIEPVDTIQIKRWKAFKRHYMQVKRNCMVLNLDCRKKQRQALLQWAYDPFF